MHPLSRNQRIRRELDNLLREGLLDQVRLEQLRERYPTPGWDWRSLGRWFLIFGTVSVMAGLAILGRNFFQFTLTKLAILQSLSLLITFGAAQWVKRTYPQFAWTAPSLELLGGLILIGLTFNLGVIFSTGSGNWPRLLLVDLILLLILSYALRNTLLVTLSAIVFFSWFGGFTGYASGWGAYWFGMSYPLRFLMAAIVIMAIAVIHQQSEQGPLAPFRGFFKVWLSSGLFFAEMALWLLSLFGNFDLDNQRWDFAQTAELFLFNALWTGLNLVLLVAGAHWTMRMLTGYGATFLIIQLYTLFFAHLATNLGLPFSLLLAGGSALALTLYVERRRQDKT